MAWQVHGQPLPLDDRIFAAIYHFDARNVGSAVQYFDRVMKERDREKDAAQKAYRSTLQAEAREFRDSTKIRSIGPGNKFALHHDGTIMPSRGEVNWSLERAKHLPKRVREDQERARS